MSAPNTDPLLVVLLGPTASGKTALSLALAERFGGEIVSCDSVAVYREMEIGSAKPSLEERSRAPHHLIDVFAPDEQCTAGDYARLARAAIADITARGGLPIVTGGTGLYLRALVDGLFAGPQRSQELRMHLERSHLRFGSGWLSRILQRLDPAAAATIHANDTPKLIRAIEVCIAARQPMTEAWLEQGRDRLTGYRILRIGLDPERKALYERINRRAAQMFSDGLVEETRALIAKYGEFPGAGSPVESEDRVSRGPMDALGYRQARALLRSESTEAEAITAAQQGHRNYAKRQLTWFRREPEVRWLPGFGDDPEIEAQATELVNRELRSKF
ncbi:tRNA (adenosine(37)-N6)-dimethylallyltransferase MiaA [Silvibacterium dinghuense]|uniref:tRNA (adenosine(37)-N6)-dimethylallyltransferase MiaA n=1 Tax=Silvibacterium dinghuense TaxID=1560006 RepID=UPI001E5B14D3|nr:tRNA (adenosine(37)-N6)-dimethylallyltransferase MiaA [Silvibacterium dinghuense]